MTSVPDRDAWVYERLARVLPGTAGRPAAAVGLQFVGFEIGVLALVWGYDLSGYTAVVGTVAVGVAAIGSVAMLTVGRILRDPGVPARYRRVVLGSDIEIVLGVLAYAGLLTYLFVADPADGGPTLFGDLFGDPTPAPVAFLALLILWDLCYRVGAAWWAGLVALWRSLRLDIEPAVVGDLRRADFVTLGFGLSQLALLPFVFRHPLLVAAVVGHVGAVILVTGGSLILLRRGQKT